MELFIGAVVSIVVEAVKSIVKPRISESNHNLVIRLILVILALFGALTYHLALSLEMLESTALVIVTGAGIFNLFIKDFKK